MILIYSMPWDTTQGPLRVIIRKSDPNLTKMEVWVINSHGLKILPHFFRCWKCFQGIRRHILLATLQHPSIYLTWKHLGIQDDENWWKLMKIAPHLIPRKSPQNPPGSPCRSPHGFPSNATKAPSSHWVFGWDATNVGKREICSP